jgi:hypothetical protein
LAAQRLARQRFPSSSSQQAPALLMPRWAVRLAFLRRVPNQHEFHLHRPIQMRGEQGPHSSRQPGHLPPAQADERQTTQPRRRSRPCAQQRPATNLLRAIGEHLLDRRQVTDVLRQ